MQRLLAALIFFTRLPLWRISQPDAHNYSRVVELWPVVGWLTGATLAGTFWLASLAVPPFVAIALALIARTLLTGALHEDGLADFCDAFGGGTTPDRILAIMKDSHIGTYGVIGLIFYYITLVGAIASSNLPIREIALILFAADIWSKFCAAQIINVLPYARQQAKNQTIYRCFTPTALITTLLLSVWVLPLIGYPTLLAAIAPMFTSALIFTLLHHKIHGYTGDCCGATFLIGELAFILTAIAIANHHTISQ